MNATTEYETTRKTVVKRSAKPAPIAPMEPWPSPEGPFEDVEGLGHPGGPRGMIELMRADHASGWVLVDGCVPLPVANMIKAAYAVMRV